jgi:hypothetical protein
VFVAAAGTAQTARVRSTATALSYNPGTGELTAVDFNSVSDQSLKTNIQDINNSWTILNQLRPVSFDWKNMDKHSYGFIAQEVEQILPSIVSSAENGKTISYMQLIPLLLHAIKQQHEEIQDLKKWIGPS